MHAMHDAGKGIFVKKKFGYTNQHLKLVPKKLWPGQKLTSPNKEGKITNSKFKPLFEHIFFQFLAHYALCRSGHSNVVVK